MAVSQKSIQERAYRLAVSLGMDPHSSPIVDNTFVFEDAFPFALRQAIVESLQQGGDMSMLQRDYDLTLTDGSVTLPDTVIGEGLKSSMVYSEDDPTIAKLSSWQNQYPQYLYPAFPQLGHYHAQGDNFLYREPGGDAGAFDGELHLVVTGMPDPPAALTTDLALPTDVVERTISILANMIKGAATGGEGA